MDLISRQAVNDELKKLAYEKFTVADWYEFYCDALADADEIIEKLPTIDPVKHGKWKNKQMFDENLNPTIAFRYRCSECRFEICTTDERIWWHFCPNCGAHMDE